MIRISSRLQERNSGNNRGDFETKLTDFRRLDYEGRAVFSDVSRRRKPITTEGDALGSSHVQGNSENRKRQSSGSAYEDSNPPRAADLKTITASQISLLGSTFEKY